MQRKKIFQLWPYLALFFVFNATLCSALGNQEPSETQFANVNAVTVKVPDWNVSLEKTFHSDTVSVSLSAYDSRLYNVDLRQAGRELILKIDRKPGFFLSRTGNPSLAIQLPENIDIDIQNNSGDIILRDRVNGQLKLETVSGEVRGREVRGNILIKSSSGDVTFDSVNGDIAIEVNSGNIRLENAEGVLFLSTASGNIELRSSVARIEAESTSGDIRLYHFEVFDSAFLSSNSGDISVELQGNLEQFQFLVQSASGEIRVFNQRAERRLQAGEGPVYISIASGSGDVRIY